MIIRPFEKGDISRILVKDNQINEWNDARSQDGLLVDTYAFTAVHDGEVIACAGMVPRYTYALGIVDVWAMFSDRLGEFKLPIYRQMKKHIKLLREAGWHHFSTPVIKSSDEAIRFIESFGFKRIGELNKYLWKQDYWLYGLSEED